MLKETITYTDYNDVEKTEDFFFNLNETELMEMEMSKDGSLTSMINKIVAAKDNYEIIKVFKGLILKAYGEKSPDGKYFVKNDEIRERFSQTEAYNQLFMRLGSDAKYAAEFLQGLLPKAIVDDKSVKAEIEKLTAEK